MPGLFPECRYAEDRPFVFDEKIIFVTARSHASETPGSVMLDGMLEMLTNTCHQQSILLENFVFVFVPMLNPDGVYRGHHHLDALG